LLLAAHGVPFWLLTLGFGHNDMFWYRLIERLGRNSLVGVSAVVCNANLDRLGARDADEAVEQDGVPRGHFRGRDESCRGHRRGWTRTLR
jgi:hypothetical protein